MRSPLRIAAFVALTAVALSGCVRVQIDLTLAPDDTVSGTMVLALQEGIGELLDTTDAQAAEQLFGETTASFDDAVVTEYAEDGYVGQQVSFEGQAIGSFALDAGEFSISRDGDTYVVNGPVDTKAAANGTDIPASAQMWLSVTFPGPVYEHNGSLTGNTVTWDLTDAPAELHAVGAAAPASDAPGWLLAAIGVALLLAVAVVLVVVLRRRGAPHHSPRPMPSSPANPSPPQPALSPAPDEKAP